jgi:hypothetical protein
VLVVAKVFDKFDARAIKVRRCRLTVSDPP